MFLIRRWQFNNSLFKVIRTIVMPLFTNKSSFLIAVLIVWYACGVGSVMAAGPADEELLSKLSAQWAHQRSAIQSAVIQYRYVHRTASPNRNYEDVISMVKEAASRDDMTSWKTLISNLDTGLEKRDVVWQLNTFTMDGQDVRVDSVYEGVTRSQAVVGENSIYSRPLSTDGSFQIDLHRRGQSQMRVPSINDFAWVPSPRFIELAEIVSQGVVDGIRQSTIKSGIREIVVTEGLGFVLELRDIAPGLPRSNVLLQFGKTVYPSDVVLANASFSGVFEKGKLRTFRIRLIDEAEINTDVDTDAFVVTAKEGDVIFDVRTPAKSVTRTDQALSNVLDRPPTPALPAATPLESSKTRKGIGSEQ